MEWVETTGRTLEEAKEAALDQLGIASEDAEFDVVEEPRSGLFGRVRQEARVRARVRPSTPRPKNDRRDRRRKGAESTADASTDGAEGAPVSDSAPIAPPARATARVPRGRGRSAAAAVEAVAEDLTADVVGEGAAPVTRERTSTRRAATGTAKKEVQEAVPSAPEQTRPRGAEMDDEPSLSEQRETVKEFLEGLVDAFGATATTEVEEVDDETLEARVIGDDLGLLIGPKGATLQAVQEVTRTVVQRAAEPGRGARLRVDIGGYREHRREALSRFTRTICDQVLASGEAVALEAMSAPDRKVVHDTVNEIEGVSSSSEGEDPNRRVVIRAA